MRMRISVYITSYNQRKYLKEAVESVLAQTLKPCQIVIVDDCSSDDSKDVIAGYQSRYPDLIAPIYHQKNMGIAGVRIDALKAVTGDYVSFVDGDDRFFPTKLEKEAELLIKNPDAQIAFSNYNYIDANGARKGTWADREKLPQGYIFCQTFARDFPNRSLFRSELVNYHAWKKIGFHDPSLLIYEDYDMRIRLTKKLKAVYCDELLSEYRRHDSGLSRCGASCHLEALEYIYSKNRSMLADVKEADRDYVEHTLGKWMAQIAQQASRESLQKHNRLQAAKYLIKAQRYCPSFKNVRSAMRILMPY